MWLAALVAHAAATVPFEDGWRFLKADAPGAIVAVDNADVTSHEPFQASERHAFRGQASAIVRRAEYFAITVTASAPGLAPGKLELP
jgi:beta-galactosidase